jgi:TrmH family RNA methyltransferase
MITSSQNSRVKLARNLLARAKSRYQEKRFVVEGLRIVQDALDADVLPEYVLYRADIAPDHPIGVLVDELKARQVDCVSVDPTIFDAISDAGTPQGILAVCPQPPFNLPSSPNLVLVLDGVRTPGNLGSALRTGVAVGIDGAILTPGTVDPFNPKVVRGAMGAHFRLPIVEWDWSQIQELQLPIIVADVGGTDPLYNTDLTVSFVLVIGGEAHGPRRESIRRADQIITIPMQDGESLNAAVAASVILYEAYRQRHFGR